MEDFLFGAQKELITHVKMIFVMYLFQSRLHDLNLGKTVPRA